MLNKTNGIVLHHVKYGESSIIVTLYTEKYGRIACMVSGIRSKNTRFPSYFFQPLTLLELNLYYRQNRNVQRLKEASCPYHYNSIPFDITKNAIALFLAEVLYITLREEESNPALFAFIFHALQYLDAKERNLRLFHPWFMLHLSRYLGFYPYQYLDGTERDATETIAFNGLSDALNRVLLQMGSNPQSPPELPITSHERNELLERIIRYYSAHMEGFTRIQSFAILRDVFNY